MSSEFEIGWTSATLFLALFIFWWVSSSQLSALVAPKNALEIHVVAKQWMWKTQHSNGAREINELHVPLDTPVRLVMTSEDVIHSFFVPAFRMKQDVLPGRYTETWFQATKLGVFHLFCAEYCGSEHSRMTGRIVVVQKDDYAAWLAAQPEGDGLAQRRRAVFRRAGMLRLPRGILQGACPQSERPLRTRGSTGGRPHRHRRRGLSARFDADAASEMLSLDSNQSCRAIAGILTDGEIMSLTAYIRSLSAKRGSQAHD